MACNLLLVASIVHDRLTVKHRAGSAVLLNVVGLGVLWVLGFVHALEFQF